MIFFWFFLFFYTQIIPLSQLVRVGFDHPDNQREEISLGLNPNWHPWWFFFCQTKIVAELNYWLEFAKLKINEKTGCNYFHRCPFFFYGCALLMTILMIVNPAANMIYFFPCMIQSSPAHFRPLISTDHEHMKSLTSTDHFKYIVIVFYIIVPRHYKWTQALKGNTSTGTHTSCERCRGSHICPFSNTHRGREGERFKKPLLCNEVKSEN